MKEHIDSFLALIDRVDKSLKLCFSIIIAAIGLLVVDRYKWLDFDLGVEVRIATLIAAFLSGAVIVVALIVHGAVQSWRGVGWVRQTLAEGKRRRMAPLIEAKARAQAALQQTWDEADRENAERDRYADLSKWVHSLEDPALRYLAAIYKYKEDEFWTDPRDPIIRRLVERQFLDEFGGRELGQGYRYVVPDATKLLLLDLKEVFDRHDDIERQPWRRFDRNAWIV